MASDERFNDNREDLSAHDAELLTALDRGEFVREPTTEEDESQLIAGLDQAAANTPDDVDDMLVVGTLRLTVRTRRQLESYAESIGVKPTVLMRQWIEESLARTTGEPGDPIAELERAVARVRQVWQQTGPCPPLTSTESRGVTRTFEARG